jgi:hypothetical protein
LADCSKAAEEKGAPVVEPWLEATFRGGATKQQPRLPRVVGVRRFGPV